MSVQKVSQVTDVKGKSYALSTGSKLTTQLNQGNNSQSPIVSSFDSKLLKEYFVSFKGSSKNQDITAKKLKEIDMSYTQEGSDLVEKAAEIAKSYGHSEINELHIEKAALESFKEYLEDVDSGSRKLDLDAPYGTPGFFASFSTDEVIKDKKQRDKLKPLIEAEQVNLDDKLSKLPNSGGKLKEKPGLSKALVNRLFDAMAEEKSMGESNIAQVTDASFLNAIYYTNQKEQDNIFKQFIMKFSEEVMIDKLKPEERIPLHLYDDTVKNIRRNFSLGTNMFLVRDKGVEPNYLIDTFMQALDTIKDPDDKMNSVKTNVLVFNKNTKERFLADKIREIAKQHSNENHVLFVNLDKLDPDLDFSIEDEPCFGDELTDIIKNRPKNVRLAFIQEKDSYYPMMSKPLAQKFFENFGEISIPVLSPEQAKKAFREQPLLMNKIGTAFSRKAVDKVIEQTALLEGNYPEKAQKIMKRVASYYADANKHEIDEADVKNYLQQARDLFTTTNEKSSVEIVFNTGKKLKDFLGKNATRNEAEAIVKRMKNKTLGTKGAIIYSQDGSVGSGRKFTAKAIAGEAKAPYVEINALDFGTKDVDIFGGGFTSPESSIRKLFSLLTAQAEANSNKAAVLFVENFEYFSVGEMVSEYHQKAMSQLLREMDGATKKGLNILILGSVSDPRYIGESTIKSFKFVDQIEVESPSRDINARKAILQKYVNKSKLKLAGETEAERNQVLKLMAETTDYFPFVYLVNLVEKVKTVVFERGHKAVESDDVTEAYLRLTTGRPASAPMSAHKKKIVTTHESGHGLNLEYLWNLAKKQNIPWHLPDRVNFITLDPRGVFGGAMFEKKGGNDEMTFEKVFSDIVCCFGGHSCEKNFYNIDGSWGITCDMQMATAAAQDSVGIMGQGHYFGKQSLEGNVASFISEHSKELFEKDVKVILENACLVSDLITKVHEDFHIQFTEKYHSLVGTGKCIVQGDKYREELAAWYDSLSDDGRSIIDKLDKTVLDIIEDTKHGKIFDMNHATVNKTIKEIYKRIPKYIK